MKKNTAREGNLKEGHCCRPTFPVHDTMGVYNRADKTRKKGRICTQTLSTVVSRRPYPNNEADRYRRLNQPWPSFQKGDTKAEYQHHPCLAMFQTGHCGAATYKAVITRPDRVFLARPETRLTPTQIMAVLDQVALGSSPSALLFSSLAPLEIKKSRR